MKEGGGGNCIKWNVTKIHSTTWKEGERERRGREMRAGSVGLQAVNITQSNSGARAFPLTLVF